MTIGSGIQAVLRDYFNNFKGFSVATTDERNT
jgi:hypothetical protein